MKGIFWSLLLLALMRDPIAFAQVSPRPGSYFLGSKQIILVNQGNSWCYVGISQHGMTVSSLLPDRQDSNRYKIHQFNGFLVIKDQNTLSFGGADYTYDPMADLDVLHNIPEAKLCLNSQRPYGITLENR